MKTLLLLLSLSAVAVGQTLSKPDPNGVQWDREGNYYCFDRLCPTPTAASVSAHKPHKRKPLVKPEEVRKQWQAELGGTVCDGISCVGPVEMMPQNNGGVHVIMAGTGITNHVAPDKAAVPVEQSLTVTTAYPNAVDVSASDGSKAIRLSDSEYSHLQQLRAAVVEEEKRLAEKYGADPGHKLCDMGCVWMKLPDHYEFHGQFLLIDRGGK